MADYIVTGPDGKKYRFSGETPEAVQEAVTQYFGGAAAQPDATASAQPAAPAKEPSLVDRVMDTVTGYGTQAGAGLREGIVNLAGLIMGDLPAAVTNAATFGVNKLTGAEIPYVDKPWLGGENLNEMFPKAPAPASAGQRITRRVGQEVGAMALPTAGALGTAAKVGVQGAREMGPIARMFVEPAAVAPAKFAGKEAAGAVTAGGAAGVAGEFTGKNQAEAQGQKPTTNQQLADTGAAIGGYGTAAVGKKVIETTGDVIGAIAGRTSMENKVARDIATDEIARAAGLVPNAKGAVDTEGLATDLTIPRPNFDAIPGMKPSTADVTGNPGIASKEYSRQSGPNAGAFKARRDENIEAIASAVDAEAPNGQPGTFRDALDISRNQRIADAGGRLATAETEAAAAVAPITPRTARGERGNVIRTELDAASEAAQARVREAYEAADVNDVPLTPTFLAEALDRTTAGLSQAERTFTPQGLIDRVAQLPAGEPTTLREATSLRSVLADQRRAAVADPARQNEARVLSQYINAVDQVIDASMSPDQRALLQAARQEAYGQKQAFTRKGDPVAGILATNEGGTPKMRDDVVARTATRNDALERVLQQADTPATRQAIRDELLSNADTATAAGLRDFQQQYAQQLARFPGINDELGAAIRARVAEGTARGEAGAVAAEMGPDGRGPVATYLRYGNENSERAMRNVLASKDPARAIDDLLEAVGNDRAAVEGARTAFWDLMKKETRSAGSSTATTSGVQPFLPAQLKGFLDDPVRGAVMARLWRDNPEHIDNVRKIADTIQSIDVRSRARAHNSSGTAQGMQSILPTTETIASRAFALQRGQVGPTFLAVNMLSIVARKAVAKRQGDLIGKLVDKALLEPDFAAALLRENNPANRTALQRGARTWLGNEAGTLTRLLNEEDTDADVKGAAMKP